MTIKDLRKILESFPDDMPVAYSSLDWKRDYAPASENIVCRRQVKPMATGWKWLSSIDQQKIDPATLVDILVIG